MKRGFVASVAFAVMLLFSASMLLAQEKAVSEKEKGSCEKAVKLTDEQKAKLEQLKMDHRMKAIDLRAEREKLGLQFKKEWMKPEPSAQALESLVKQMSAVREKMQLNGIEQMLAMRKLLGPDWRMLMKSGAGHSCEMMGGEGMPMAGDGECCPMMGAMLPHGEAAGGCSGVEKRVVRIVGEGAGAGCGMGAMKGGCMMQKPGMGAGCGMGAMKGGCHMKQGAGSCCPSSAGKRNSRMFRPFGKKECCSIQKCGAMGKGSMGAGCGGGSMKGGCMMHQGKGCAGGMEGKVSKEAACPMEMKKEIDKKVEKKAEKVE